MNFMMMIQTTPKQFAERGHNVMIDVTDDVAQALLKACSSIKWHRITRSRSKLVPTEEDAGMLIFSGFLLATCHLDHALDLQPNLPQALALQASLALMSGCKKSAKKNFKKLLISNPMDVRCFTLCHVLQDQMDKDKPNCRKIMRAVEPLIKKIEHDCK
jgi:hypothetical protein